eukprot:scaffold119055_cov57-Phaeocystis_antarctica.AAC.1
MPSGLVLVVWCTAQARSKAMLRAAPTSSPPPGLQGGVCGWTWVTPLHAHLSPLSLVSWSRFFPRRGESRPADAAASPRGGQARVRRPACRPQLTGAMPKMIRRPMGGKRMHRPDEDDEDDDDDDDEEQETQPTQQAAAS